MIDIHTHILPGVDDGAGSYEDALVMLEAYDEQGIEAVVLTPHVAPRRGFFNTRETLGSVFEALLEKVKQRGLGIKIYLGSEFDEGDSVLEDIKAGVTLNDTRFVLLDFGMREADIADVVYEMMIKGYRVIIAHVERYAYVSFEDIKRYRKEGALIQVNAKHLLKKGSKEAQKMALKLLKHDLIDIVASDMHHKENLTDFKEAYALVTKKKNKETAEKLFASTPRLVIGIR